MGISLGCVLCHCTYVHQAFEHHCNSDVISNGSVYRSDNIYIHHAMEIIINQILTPDGTILVSDSPSEYVAHMDSKSSKVYGVGGGMHELKRFGDNDWSEMTIWSSDTDDVVREKLHVKIEDRFLSINKLTKKQIKMYLKKKEFNSLYDGIVKSVLSSMLSLFLVTAYGQGIVVPKDYKVFDLDDNNCSVMYKKAFKSKLAAVRGHLRVLGSNDIDTSSTSVDIDMDTPIFSFFYEPNNYDRVFITYVTKSDYTGLYNSMFMECENKPFDLFESDGYLLSFEPSKNKRK